MPACPVELPDSVIAPLRLYLFDLPSLFDPFNRERDRSYGLVVSLWILRFTSFHHSEKCIVPDRN